MTEKGSQVSFRESIVGQVPELSNPFIVKTPLGLQQWPFKEIEQDAESSKSKVVFEAHSIPNAELNPLIVRVSYEADYGLNAKKTLFFCKPPESDESLFQGAEVRRVFGNIEIFYSMGLSGPFITEALLKDPNNFNASILVTSGADLIIPPLAWVEYSQISKIPIIARYPDADFQQALVGDVEKRQEQQTRPGSYKETFFQWEHLVGAKVGVSRYDDPNRKDSPRYYHWPTEVNSREAVHLKDTPYRSKITRSAERMYPGVGRLRFSRMNSETGESWVFSVPDWFTNDMFYSDIQDKNLLDFFYRYPVVFCVKRRGEERMWYSTWGLRDQGKLRPRKFLNEEPQHS